MDDVLIWNEKQIAWVQNTIENLPMSDQDTIIVATNRINVLEYSRENSKTLFGRLSQWLAPENLNQISIHIKELERLYEMARMEIKEDINISHQNSGEVLIDHNFFKQLVKKAINKSTNNRSEQSGTDHG